MIAPPVDALAEALSRSGPWGAFVRTTETGEAYIDLAMTPQDQPSESVWFDPHQVVWGDQYQHALALDGRYPQIALAILYTMRDDA